MPDRQARQTNQPKKPAGQIIGKHIPYPGFGNLFILEYRDYKFHAVCHCPVLGQIIRQRHLKIAQPIHHGDTVGHYRLARQGIRQLTQTAKRWPVGIEPPPNPVPYPKEMLLGIHSHNGDIRVPRQIPFLIEPTKGGQQINTVRMRVIHSCNCTNLETSWGN